MCKKQQVLCSSKSLVNLLTLMGRGSSLPMQQLQSWRLGSCRIEPRRSSQPEPLKTHFYWLRLPKVVKVLSFADSPQKHSHRFIPWVCNTLGMQRERSFENIKKIHEKTRCKSSGKAWRSPCWMIAFPFGTSSFHMTSTMAFTLKARSVDITVKSCVLNSCEFCLFSFPPFIVQSGNCVQICIIFQCFGLATGAASGKIDMKR